MRLADPGNLLIAGATHVGDPTRKLYDLSCGLRVDQEAPA